MKSRLNEAALIDKTNALISAPVSIISPRRNRIFQKLLRLRWSVGILKTPERELYVRCSGGSLAGYTIGE